MFIIPSIDLSMKLSLSEVFVSNIIVTMVISNKSCCKHVLFTNLSDFISTTTRVTSLKSKKFLFCSFSVAKFGIAPIRLEPGREHFVELSAKVDERSFWRWCITPFIRLSPLTMVFRISNLKPGGATFRMRKIWNSTKSTLSSTVRWSVLF